MEPAWHWLVAPTPPAALTWLLQDPPNSTHSLKPAQAAPPPPPRQRGSRSPSSLRDRAEPGQGACPGTTRLPRQRFSRCSNFRSHHQKYPPTLHPSCPPTSKPLDPGDESQRCAVPHPRPCHRRAQAPARWQRDSGQGRHSCTDPAGCSPVMWSFLHGCQTPVTHRPGPLSPALERSGPSVRHQTPRVALDSAPADGPRCHPHPSLGTGQARWPPWVTHCPTARLRVPPWRHTPALTPRSLAAAVGGLAATHRSHPRLGWGLCTHPPTHPPMAGSCEPAVPLPSPGVWLCPTHPIARRPGAAAAPAAAGSLQRPLGAQPARVTQDQDLPRRVTKRGPPPARPSPCPLRAAGAGLGAAGSRSLPRRAASCQVPAAAGSFYTVAGEKKSSAAATARAFVSASLTRPLYPNRAAVPSPGTAPRAAPPLRRGSRWARGQPGRSPAASERQRRGHAPAPWQGNVGGHNPAAPRARAEAGAGGFARPGSHVGTGSGTRWARAVGQMRGRERGGAPPPSSLGAPGKPRRCVLGQPARSLRPPGPL